MKTLYETLLDDFDTLGAPLNAKTIKEQIKEFLKENYMSPSNAKISRKPNENGLYVVDWTRDLIPKSDYIEQLTNGLFEFGEVNGKFSCSRRQKLKTLKGCPKIVKGDFNLSDCISLESLEGGPEIVHGTFEFSGCLSLTSLKGAPKKCQKVTHWNGWSDGAPKACTMESFEGFPEAKYILLEGIGGVKNLKGLPQKGVLEFDVRNLPDLESLEGGPTGVAYKYACYDCPKLKSLKGCPDVVQSLFSCNGCHSLKNFEGAPKEVGHIQAAHCKWLDGKHPEVLKGFPKKAYRVEVFVRPDLQNKYNLEPFTVEQICAVCDVDPRNVRVTI